MGEGATPVATAQPVPPPVNTLATPARGVGANALNAPPMAATKEIAQTYAPAMTGAAPAVAAAPPLTATSPNAVDVADTKAPAGAPNAAQPTVPATALPVDAIQAEIAALADKADQLYSLRNPFADAEAKRVEARIKLLRDQLPKGSLVNINMPEEAKSFEDKVGKEGVKAAYEGLTKAEDAVQIIRNVEVGRDILDEGAITGAGANFFVGVNQALKTAGMDFGYADASANSQAYAAAMGQNVGRIITLFGAGTGLSDADRAYAEQMAAGKINLDEAALRKILRINEDAGRLGVEAHNKRMEKMGAPDYLKVDSPPFNVDRVPPAAIEMLRNDPKLKKKFDQKYGYGYSDFILGNQNGR